MSRRSARRRPACPTAPESPTPTVPAQRHPLTPRPPAPAGGRIRRFAHAQRTGPPPTPPASSAPQTPTPARSPGPTTAHHRSRTEADAPQKSQTTVRASPVRRRSGPAPRRHAIRTSSPAHRAAGREGRPRDRAEVHTTDAAPQTPAPSPPPPQPRAAPADPTPTRSRSQAARSSQPPPLRATPARRSGRYGLRPAARQVPRIRLYDRAAATPREPSHREPWSAPSYSHAPLRPPRAQLPSPPSPSGRSPGSRLQRYARWAIPHMSPAAANPARKWGPWPGLSRA